MEQKKTFEPFERIILRRKEGNKNKELWFCCEFSNYDTNCITTVGGNVFCIEEYDILPFEGNEHLVGTSDMPCESVELKEDELILVFDDIRSFEDFIMALRKFVGIHEETIITGNSFYWKYCIPFSQFNPNDIKETRKHILCVKNGKLVRANLKQS